MLISIVKQRLALRNRYRLWRRKNAHNDTAPKNDFDQSLVTVGAYIYGGIKVYIFNCNSI